jgi:hypothetical protein
LAELNKISESIVADICFKGILARVVAMHELFLTAHLSDDDVQRAIRILQGYCGMSPVTLVRRRMLFEGPRLRQQLKGIDPVFVSKQPQGKQLLWKSLHEQITRQAYIIALIFDINKDHFGQPEVSESQGVVDEPSKNQPWVTFPRSFESFILSTELSVLRVAYVSNF